MRSLQDQIADRSDMSDNPRRLVVSPRASLPFVSKVQHPLLLAASYCVVLDQELVMSPPTVSFGPALPVPMRTQTPSSIFFGPRTAHHRSLQVADRILSVLRKCPHQMDMPEHEAPQGKTCGLTKF